MPRTCSICAHHDRAAIDEALVGGHRSFRDIARQWRVSKDAVARHKAHLPATLVQAREAQEVASADALLEQVRALHQRTMTVLDQAETAGNVRVMLPAIREARANLELLARLLGDLNDRAQVTVGVALTQPAKAVGPDERERRIVDRICDDPTRARIASQFFMMMSEIEDEVGGETCR